MLTENRTFLASKFSGLLKVVDHLESFYNDSFKLELVESKSSMPTLCVTKEGQSNYLHSKYDPQAEAEKLIASYPDVSRYRHVLFYGMGMAYHIEAFMKVHPQMEFTIFEPSPQILKQYLSYRSLKSLPLQFLQDIATASSPFEVSRFFSEFINKLHGEVLLFTLPSYERLFKTEYEQFVTEFTKMVNSKRNDMLTNYVYQKKWTLNCIRNLPQVLNTPSFLQSVYKIFQDKPAIIVAAGPSVMDDLENLRHIKENKLAYIFAAGSGLIPMLNAGIIPDAIVSYDPNFNNCVIEPVIKQNIASLPLIFGSSVGFDKLSEYPGPKLHFLLNQDTLASFYLKNVSGEPLQFIHDQSTISGIILQLLYLIGSNPIVFTGQNLGFRGDLRYAPGIGYYNPNLTEEQQKNAFITEDVYGGQIYTDNGYRMMRENLELMIDLCKSRRIFNATKGGAKIAGAPFRPLEQLIEEDWKDSVVVENWSTHHQTSYDQAYFQKQSQTMEAAYQSLKKVFTQLERMIRDFPDVKIKGNRLQANTALVELNKKFKRMTSNLFFETFIMPQRRVELDIFSIKITENDLEPDETVRIVQLQQLMAQFIRRCKSAFDEVEPFFYRMQKSFE